MWCAEKRGSSWRFSPSASRPQGQLDIRHYAASSLRGDRPHWPGGAPRMVRSAAADLHAADDPATAMVAHATVFPPAAAMAWRDMPRGRTVPLCKIDSGIGGNATRGYRGSKGCARTQRSDNHASSERRSANINQLILLGLKPDVSQRITTPGNRSAAVTTDLSCSTRFDREINENSRPSDRIQKRQMSGTMKTATTKNQISSGRPSFQ